MTNLLCGLDVRAGVTAPGRPEFSPVSPLGPTARAARGACVILPGSIPLRPAFLAAAIQECCTPPWVCCQSRGGRVVRGSILCPPSLPACVCLSFHGREPFSSPFSSRQTPTRLSQPAKEALLQAAPGLVQMQPDPLLRSLHRRGCSCLCLSGHPDYGRGPQPMRDGDGQGGGPCPLFLGEGSHLKPGQVWGWGPQTSARARPRERELQRGRVRVGGLMATPKPERKPGGASPEPSSLCYDEPGRPTLPSSSANPLRHSILFNQHISCALWTRSGSLTPHEQAASSRDMCTEGLGNLPKVTLLVGGRTEIGALTVWNHSPSAAAQPFPREPLQAETGPQRAGGWTGVETAGMNLMDRHGPTSSWLCGFRRVASPLWASDVSILE